MVRINLIRAAAWAPVGLLLGAMVGWADYGDPLKGFDIALRILLFWAAALPFMIAGRFSKRTNDTANLRPFGTIPWFSWPSRCWW